MSKILVVETNEKSSTKLQELLNNWGYEAIIVDNGNEAFKAVLEEQPDLVITRIYLPGLNGYEICNEIRQNVFIADMPVILFSDILGKEEQIHGFNVGADMCIAKSVDDEVLKAIIDGIIIRKKRDDRKESWRSLTRFWRSYIVNSNLICVKPAELIKREEKYCEQLARGYDISDRDSRHLRMAIYLQDLLIVLNKITPDEHLKQEFTNLRIAKWLMPLLDGMNLPEEQKTPAINIFNVITAYGRIYTEKKENADAALTALRRAALADGGYDLEVLKRFDKLVREEKLLEELQKIIKDASYNKKHLFCR